MKSTVFGILFILATLTLRAEITVGASLEWLADTSISIGTYQITESRKQSESSFQLSLKLEDSLKGKPPQKAESSYWMRLPTGSKPPSIAVGDRFLIFLKRDDKNLDRVAHIINLATSQFGGMDSVAINHKFEVLSDQATILAAVRGRIEKHPKAAPTKWEEYPSHRFDVDVPIGSPAFTVLYGGSTCYLLLPDDLKPAKAAK